jgi:hypothetical protein
MADIRLSEHPAEESRREAEALKNVDDTGHVGEASFAPSQGRARVVVPTRTAGPIHELKALLG